MRASACRGPTVARNLRVIGRNLRVVCRSLCVFSGRLSRVCGLLCRAGCWLPTVLWRASPLLTNTAGDPSGVATENPRGSHIAVLLLSLFHVSTTLIYALPDIQLCFASPDIPSLLLLHPLYCTVLYCTAFSLFRCSAVPLFRSQDIRPVFVFAGTSALLYPLDIRLCCHTHLSQIPGPRGTVLSPLILLHSLLSLTRPRLCCSGCSTLDPQPVVTLLDPRLDIALTGPPVSCTMLDPQYSVAPLPCWTPGLAVAAVAYWTPS